MYACCPFDCSALVGAQKGSISVENVHDSALKEAVRNIKPGSQVLYGSDEVILAYARVPQC